jgi:hypothetical protein
MKRIVIAAMITMSFVSAYGNERCIVNMANGTSYIREQTRCVTTQHAGSPNWNTLGKVALVVIGLGLLANIIEKNKANKPAIVAVDNTPPNLSNLNTKYSNSDDTGYQVDATPLPASDIPFTSDQITQINSNDSNILDSEWLGQQFLFKGNTYVWAGPNGRGTPDRPRFKYRKL